MSGSLSYAQVNLQLSSPESKMVDKQGDIIGKSKKQIAKDNQVIQRTEEQSPPNINQSVPQEGKFNTAIAEGTNVQVGDQYHGLDAEGIRAVVQALGPLLPHTYLHDESVAVDDDSPLPMLSFEAELAERINSRLTTLEELRKSGQLAQTQAAAFNQVKGKVRSMMEMQQELEAIAANADRLLQGAINDLTEKLRELELSQDDSFFEARSQECLKEQLEVLQQFQAELSDGKVVAHWLNRERSKELAVRLGQYALSLHCEIRESSTQKQIDAFQLSIDLFLERLGHCLTWGRNNSLDSSVILMILEEKVYTSAFEKLKTEIPAHLPENGISQLLEYTDYLIQRLPSYERIDAI